MLKGTIDSIIPHLLKLFLSIQQALSLNYMLKYVLIPTKEDPSSPGNYHKISALFTPKQASQPLQPYGLSHICLHSLNNKAEYAKSSLI